MKLKTMNTIEQLKRELHEGVSKVLSGESKKFQLEGICPNWIKIYLELNGYECSDLDTNGWDSDWWLRFTKDEKSFTAFGSGYYGNFEFGPTEE